MFHGSSGNGARFLRISGWREQADRTGLIAVFPTGLRYRMLDTGRRITKWNGYNLAADVDLNDKPPGYPADAPWPANDVGFVDAMLGDLGPLADTAAGVRLRLLERRRVHRPAGDRALRRARGRRVLGRRAERAAPRPARPIPMYMTVGSLDDACSASQGCPSCRWTRSRCCRCRDRGDGGRAPGHARAFRGGRSASISRRRSTTLRWPAREPGFRFTVIDGLGHKYPEGAAREFWRSSWPTRYDARTGRQASGRARTSSPSRRARRRAARARGGSRPGAACRAGRSARRGSRARPGGCACGPSRGRRGRPAGRRRAPGSTK